MITIHNPTFHITLAQTEMARALFAALLHRDEPEAPETEHTHSAIGRPLIGQYLEGQGGVYAGDFRADDGSIYGLIGGEEEDIGCARWAPDGELPNLSDWDGLANTRALHDTCPAAKLAVGYRRDGHSDFYLPAQRELLLASANIRHLFGKSGWYATSTPNGSSYTWAVGFEDGTTYYSNRDNEFLVRPFRRFIY
nr:hypothetical protein [uncultured Rhodoferax sp.]